jgi:uncharacterized caspase-like protein
MWRGSGRWQGRGRFGARAVLFVASLASFGPVLPANVQAETLVYRAAQSGKQTLDQGEGGGNPFASALIEVLAAPRVTLQEFPSALSRATQAKSGGFQVPELDATLSASNWAMVPPAPGERRIALVMVVADYSKAGVNSLPGALRDAERVAEALTVAGFETERAIDLDLPALKARLDGFRTRTANYDVAAIYTTGHGVEVDGQIHLLPGDYPVKDRNRALGERAISLQRIADAARAARLNLIFYGGCRDNPFAPAR